MSSENIIYSKNVLEFTTVSVQYCVYLESIETREQQEATETLVKMLPLLYIKGVLMPRIELFGDEDELQDYVTEDNYDIVRQNISYVMGSNDEYLDVFMEDMKYSETPILTTISENLADIYQDLKNFVCAYKDSDEETMRVALATCRDNFEHYWGQKLVNVLRALHQVVYGDNINYD